MPAMIRLACPADLVLLPAIEASAATLLAGTAGARAANGAATPAKALAAGLHAGSLWVAAAPRPCGFLLAAATGGWLHIQELSVARGAQRRGLGTALLHAAIMAAPALGCARLSLTTDRWLAWNAPFYARHGFAEAALHDPALPGWLARLPAHAAADGLDPARRCVMVRAA